MNFSSFSRGTTELWKVAETGWIVSPHWSGLRWSWRTWCGSLWPSWSWRPSWVEQSCGPLLRNAGSSPASAVLKREEIKAEMLTHIWKLKMWKSWKVMMVNWTQDTLCLGKKEWELWVLKITIKYTAVTNYTAKGMIISLNNLHLINLLITGTRLWT